MLACSDDGGWWIPKRSCKALITAIGSLGVDSGSRRSCEGSEVEGVDVKRSERRPSSSASPSWVSGGGSKAAPSKRESGKASLGLEL